MNRFCAGLIGVVCTALYAGLPSQAQETKSNSVTSQPKEKLARGEFRITPSPSGNSIRMEANHASPLVLLRAIAQQTNRKIIIADDVEAKDQGRTIFSNVSNERPIDHIFDFLSGTRLSWGKVGQDTYLVVARQESPEEVTARKARIDHFLQSLKEQRQEKEKEKEKQYPEQAPAAARLWWLSPSAQ